MLSYRVSRVLFVSLLVAWAAGCSTQPLPDPSSAVTVVKSPNDPRSYRYLTLPNQLRVLLASDADVDKAAASLVALRGQNHDPESFGGLAHFLEHMLFIGTEKYPKVDEYQQFISAHGGSTNAYTAADHTNYFFDIQPEYFDQALDRFAHFFIDPLLDPAYVEREKNAVHSEYQLQIKDDGWRGYSAVKAVMNPDHPGSRFHIGSLETLGDGVQEALQRFFVENYSADQMTLVVISKHSLDTLESWVTDIFSAIPNRDIGPAQPMPPAFEAPRLPLTLTYQSLKNTNRVVYNFPVPPPEPHYREKPGLYIANLLGHEGQGSLHQHLKAAGLIESLAAGVDRLDRENAFISVDITLTEAGATQLQRITKALFAHIELLRDTPPEQWRYAEQARMAELGFRFQEPSSPTGFAYQVAPLLDQYPPEQVLAAPYLMEAFDPALIKRYLDHLTPQNVLVEVVGPNVETDQVEPWFQVPYSLSAFRPPEDPEPIAGLALPAPNDFVPEALSLLPADERGPHQVVDSPTTQLWLDQDTEFGAPRANVYLTLGVRGGFTRPDDYVLARIYQRLIADARNELTYPAFLAGLAYGLSATSQGFELRLSGYNDKQPKLLAEVLDGFTTQAIDPAKFALYQAELVRQWRDFDRERPYTQTLAAVEHLLLEGRWPPHELARALSDKTVEDLERWRQTRLNALRIEGLVHGNVSPQGVRELAELTAALLPLGTFALHEDAVTNINERLQLEVPVDHADASMVLFIQDPDATFATRARSALAVQLLRQSYFTSLRTEQQLGYVVALSNRPVRDRAGLTFIVQSPVASPAKLYAATQTFLTRQISVVESMDDDAFEQNKAGLIARLTERDKNLNDRSQRYWSDMEIGVLSFDSSEQIAEHVRRLGKPDILTFLQQANDKLRAQSLLIYNRGRFDDVPRFGKSIVDAASFKRR